MLLESLRDVSLPGRFVGRQKLVDELYQKIEKREAALVLKGPGGVGKSALVRRLADRLSKKQYSFILIEGETLPELILRRIYLEAKKMGLAQAEEIYTRGAGRDLREKILWFVENYLQKEQVALVFEDFEANLDLDGKFRNDRLKEYLTYLRDALKEKDSFLLFTSESDIPGFESTAIPGLGDEEIEELLALHRCLSRLDETSRQRLAFDMGGNPRALQLLEQIAAHEFATKDDFDWDALKKRVAGLAERILYKESEEADFSPLLLEKLLEYIDQPQEQFLKGLSLYNQPVGREALHALGLELSDKERKELQALSLVEWSQTSGRCRVHRLTTRFMLGRLGEKEKKNLHLKAARYFESLKHKEGETGIENGIAARRHYLEAEERDKAAALTFKLDQYLTPKGYVQLAFDLLKEIESGDYSRDNQLRIYQRLGFFASLFGQPDLVIARHEKLKNIYEEINDRKGVAQCLGQLAAAYDARMKYKEALENYEKSLQIYLEIGETPAAAFTHLQVGQFRQKLGKFDEALDHFRQALSIYEPGKDQAGVSEALHHIGRVHEDRGEFDEALNFFGRSLEVKEKLGDDRGMAASLHHMGNAHYLKGDFDSALDHYRRSLALSEKSGDERAAGNSLGQMGLIYQRKGQDDEAFKHYEKSLHLFEKLADQAGIASSLHQLGRIHQDRGKLDEALDHYQRALEIREKSGDMPGMGTGHGQLGLLYLEKGEYQEALRSSIKAFMIFNQLGAPQAQLAQKNIQKIKAKLPEKEFFDILAEFDIKPAEKRETKRKSRKPKK